MKTKQKLKTFKTEIEREAVVVMAVQNIGVSSIEEIIEKVESYGGKITQKQTEKCCNNLQKRQILSIDLKEDEKRFLMRRIGVSVPELGQIKAIVDARGDESEEIRALINELEASKKNAKISPNNYYDVETIFETSGKVQGFVPDGNGIDNAHYRGNENKIIFYPKHFRNWIKKALPQMNMYENSIVKIFVFDGVTDYNGKPLTIKNTNGGEIQERAFIGNIPGTHKGAGRGERIYEYVPEGTKVFTKFRIPGTLLVPEKSKKKKQKACESINFGGNSKVSTGRLNLKEFRVTNEFK